MEKIRNGKWESDIATAEEFESAVSEIKQLVSEYGFEERAVFPYSFKMTVEELVDGWTDFARCSFSSKQIMIQEMNGFIDVLNKWVEQENEPQVTVRLTNGKVKDIPESYVDDYMECGLVTELVTRCAECMWAVWDYAGMYPVECMNCDEKCPTNADIEVANEGGYLAYYGCSNRAEV